MGISEQSMVRRSEATEIINIRPKSLYYSVRHVDHSNIQCIPNEIKNLVQNYIFHRKINGVEFLTNCET